MKFHRLLITVMAATLILPAVGRTENGKGKVEMSLDEYRQLEARAAEIARAPEKTEEGRNWSVQSADYRGRMEGGVLVFEVKTSVYLSEDGEEAFPFMKRVPDTGLESVKGGRISVSREGDMYEARLSGKGEHEISFRLVSSLDKKAGMEATIPVPEAAITSLSIEFPPKWQAEVTPSIGGEISTDGGKRTLDTRVPMTDFFRVTVSAFSGRPWQVQKSEYSVTEAEDAALVRASYEISAESPGDAFVIDAGEVALSRVTVDGKEASALRRPGGFAVQGLSPGPHMVAAEWYQKIEESGSAKTVLVRLMDSPISTLEASVKGGSVNLIIEPGLNRRQWTEGGRTRARATLAPSRSVTVSWNEKPPETRKLAREAEEELRMYAEKFSLVSIEEGLMTVEDDIDFHIHRGGLSRIEFTLPDGVEVISVEGSFIKDWEHEKSDDKKLYRVYLDRKLEKDYSLKVTFETLLGQFPLENVTVPRLEPTGCEREKGVVAVKNNYDLNIKAAKLTGIRKTDLDRDRRLRGITPLYAFQYIRAPYDIALDLSMKPPLAPEVHAEVATLVNLNDGFVECIGAINYMILNAGVDDFSVSLPEDVRVTAVRGQWIRNTKQEVKDGRNHVMVHLERPAHGRYGLFLEYERLLGPEPKSVEVPFLHPEGVVSTDGSVGVAARHNFEVRDRSAENIKEIDISQLSGSIFEMTETIILRAYTYSWVKEVSSPPSLSYDLFRHRDVTVKGSYIDEARFLTQVHDNGFTLTKAVLSVRNKNRQNLKITLPPGSKLYSAFLAGEAVPPVMDDEGRILIPLPRSDLGGEGRHANFPVEVVYETNLERMERSGDIKVLLPETDISMAKALWQIYLPADRKYRSFGGTMGEPGEENKSARDISREMGEFANLLSGNFLKFQAKAKQSEAKTNLGAIFTSQVAHLGEDGRYGRSFKEIAWSPEGQTMYTYILGNDRIRNSKGLKVDLPELQGTVAGRDKFVALAVGNVDNDPFPDIWAIDQDKNLINLANDGSDTYSDKFQEYKDRGLLGQFVDLEHLQSILDQVRQSEMKGMLSLRIDVPTEGKLIRFEKLFPGSRGEKMFVTAGFAPDVLGKGAKIISRMVGLLAGVLVLVILAAIVGKSGRLAFFRRHWWLTVLFLLGAFVLIYRTWLG